MSRPEGFLAEVGGQPELEPMVRDARERSAVMAIAARRQAQDRPSIAQRGRVMVLELAERLGIKEGDPLGRKLIKLWRRYLHMLSFS